MSQVLLTRYQPIKMASLELAIFIWRPHPMSDPTLNDSVAASYVSIIGGHLYGAGLADYPLAKSLGKELWETEHYFDNDSMTNVLGLAKEIHDCMVTANMNAYTYWCFQKLRAPYPAKRCFALSG